LPTATTTIADSAPAAQIAALMTTLLAEVRPKSLARKLLLIGNDD
jgi:hypothetical protein